MLSFLARMLRHGRARINAHRAPCPGGRMFRGHGPSKHRAVKANLSMAPAGEARPM